LTSSLCKKVIVSSVITCAGTEIGNPGGYGLTWFAATTM
jgi:hypothetical protein